MDQFPKGVILPWYAKSGAFPHGWAVCDGTNGTPDLRRSFIRGVSDMADVGKTGGKEKHGHAMMDPGPINQRVGVNTGAPGAQCMGVLHHHEIPEESHLPPYVDMIFMMKL